MNTFFCMGLGARWGAVGVMLHRCRSGLAGLHCAHGARRWGCMIPKHQFNVNLPCRPDPAVMPRSHLVTLPCISMAIPSSATDSLIDVEQRSRGARCGSASFLEYNIA
jgi:hypothetical protein